MRIMKWKSNNQIFNWILYSLEGGSETNRTWSPSINISGAFEPCKNYFKSYLKTFLKRIFNVSVDFTLFYPSGYSQQYVPPPRCATTTTVSMWDARVADFCLAVFKYVKYREKYFNNWLWRCHFIGYPIHSFLKRSGSGYNNFWIHRWHLQKEFAAKVQVLYHLQILRRSEQNDRCHCIYNLRRRDHIDDCIWHSRFYLFRRIETGCIAIFSGNSQPFVVLYDRFVCF